ncbi:SNF2 family amine-terminal protein (macronuclear) [Tetrahymena thermophila SB210]|uniref:SNF2 family amine-terminal protein n=1 Tax=Tetrahymena thermophila (strain SB210) TaxID=312017 RepID=I7MI98_TETTS|nr:SNF2 family amine-terminal protein [Tetrahymena thermophila SB210]EAS04211.2 SNF2 family amine-terminal protein [Tetrahymena thermophila SB210]|eukprot:XP_001024456.2 SNF2 family amine-terminal protein [Tetrahymena thermophila SB210]
MDRFLPLTISKTYNIDQAVVEKIIKEKELKSRQEIMNFFALNKDKIQTLFQDNQIESIINEEFMDTQNIVLKQIPNLIVSKYQKANQDIIQSYCNLMRELFPKQQDLFNDISQNQLIWPKYIGSLLIPVEVSDLPSNLQANQELCINFGAFELDTKEVQYAKKKYIFNVNIESLYILIYTKRKEYLGKIDHRFFFIWNILNTIQFANFRLFVHKIESKNCLQIRFDVFVTEKICSLYAEHKEEDKNVFNKETLKEMSMEDQKKLVMRKYASESIKVMKAFLYVKETIPAILTPIERSLDLLGGIQYRMQQRQSQGPLFSFIPSKLVIKPGLLGYYSDQAQQAQNQNQQQNEQQKIITMLNQAEKAGQDNFLKDMKERDLEIQQINQIEEEFKINESEIIKNKNDQNAQNQKQKVDIQNGATNKCKDPKKAKFKNGKQSDQVNKENKMMPTEEQEIQNSSSNISSEENDNIEEENDNEDDEDDEKDNQIDQENCENNFDVFEGEEFLRNLDPNYDNNQENLWQEIPDGINRVSSSTSSTTLNSDIGSLLGVNDQQITDYFNLQNPPSLFQTSLFEYQQQALTWMLYKEKALTFEEAARPEIQERPRQLNEFWCELLFLDGSLMYFNEYSQSFSHRFQKSEANLQNGGILADEMGLGKTVMALSLIASNLPKIDHKSNPLIIGINDQVKKKVKKNKNQKEAQDMVEAFEQKKKQGLIRAGTLIILPLSVLTQWCNEVNRHFKKSSLFYFEYYDSKSRSSPILHLYDIVFTTYNILGMEYKNYFIAGAPQKTNLFNYYWHRIILDEAHTIKGKGNNCSKGAYNLQAENRWCMTGTPIHNCFDDLYSLIYFLKYDTFQDYYWWNKHINNCENKEEVFKLLQNILRPILLRRTKKSKYNDGSSIIKIPKKTQKILLIPFKKAERQIYDTLQRQSQKVLKNILIDKNQFSSNYLHIFSIMTKLRQMCDHSMLMLNKIPMIKIKQQIDTLEQQIAKNESTSITEMQAYNIFISKIVDNIMNDNDIYQFNANNQQRQQQQQNNYIQQRQQNIQFKAQVQQSLIKKDLTECFCTEPYEQEVALLQCGHFFHMNCIQEMFRVQQNQNIVPNCPMCRVPFEENQINKINFQQIKEESKELEAKIKQQVIQQVKDKKEKLKILKVLSPDNSSKLQIIVKEVKKVQQMKEKVIIYSQFLSFLTYLQKVLNDRDVRYTRLDGTMNKKDRATAIKTFSEQSEFTAILISLKAGAFGLNLVAANHVFICDPWYNPAIEEQAIERCHRIGQTKRVQVINFIMESSIEERILQCQKKKRSLIQNTLYIQKNNLSELEKEQEIQAKMKEIRYIIGFDEDENQEEKNMTKMDEEENIKEIKNQMYDDFDDGEETIVKEIDV